MNPRSPRPRLDAILYVSLLLAILWRTCGAAPWMDGYVTESRIFVELANSRLEQFLAIVQSLLETRSPLLLPGLMLLLVGGLFVGVRARLEILHTQRFCDRTCPVCGGPIVRVPRSTWHRVMEKALFLPTRRYGCRNLGCGWTGLRIGRFE